MAEPGEAAGETHREVERENFARRDHFLSNEHAALADEEPHAVDPPLGRTIKKGLCPMKALSEALRASILAEAPREQAYEAVLDELEAVAEASLVSVNLSVATVVSRVLGALPHLAGFRGEFERLPDFDLARFDRLELYAGALSYAHTRYQIATKPPDGLRALHEDARALRALLFRDVQLGIARGWIPESSIRHLRGYDGYQNTAHDLELLCGALEARWPEIEGKCGTSAEELEYASKLGFHLLRVYGLREQKDDYRAEVRAQRARAFTLLARAYSDARAALLYLLKDQTEVDRIAPSLYAGRPRPKRKGPTEAQSPTEAHSSAKAQNLSENHSSTEAQSLSEGRAPEGPRPSRRGLGRSLARQAPSRPSSKATRTGSRPWRTRGRRPARAHEGRHTLSPPSRA